MRLKTLLGDYPVTRALKTGQVTSHRVQFDYADVKVPHTAFKRVVRDLEFDVAEFREPANAERATAGKTPLGMLLEGDVDAAILSDPVPQDPRLKPVLPDPQAAIADWRRRKAPLQINHMVAIRKELAGDVSKEVFRLLSESKNLGAKDDPGCPFGIEENRRNLEVAIDYVVRQSLIPRRYSVDELFQP
jgi:4,5-dihydroxyphthalate decarboxylase